MNKILIAVIIGLMTGSLYAACQGPYCYDDKQGAYIQSGLGIFTVSSGTVGSITPAYAGQLIVCSGCTNGAAGTNAPGYNLCIASGTGQGAYTLASSTTLRCQ